MSVRAMARVFDMTGISMRDKLVLLAYTDHADHDGNNIYPSVKLMAKKVGCSERTIQRATADLVQTGLLIPDGEGPAGTNRWRFNWSWTPQDQGGDNLTPPENDEEQGGGDSPVTGGVTTVSPEPSYNHHNPLPTGEGEASPSNPVPEKEREGVATGGGEDTSIEATNQNQSSMSLSRSQPNKASPPPVVKINSRSPAIQVFRSAAHRYPAKAWYEDIATTVGSDQKDLDRWRAVVHSWVGLGWNPLNVKGMLEFYRKGTIPGDNRDQRNGRAMPKNSDRNAGLRPVSEAGALF